ncbi:AMP-binding protein [Streptomyces monticola]|uniref:AMP-binding protein n=1 Tax=Streptomyces monticola TaxID=2666263 RepID=A0ABW2JFF7_9ACTN
MPPVHGENLAVAYEKHLGDLRARQAAARRGRQRGTVVHAAGELPVAGYVRHWARLTPDKPAVVFAGSTTTYRQLDAYTDRLAGWLAARGVRPGDRVAVHLPNSAHFVVAMLAVLRLGAVHVPVNPMFRAAELRHELADSGAETVIAAEPLLPLLDEVRAETAVRRVLPVSPEGIGPEGIGPEGGGEAWRTALAHAPLGRIADDLDALAALNYTGGTTGLPKGCEHTQRHMIYTATAIDNGRTLAPGGDGAPTPGEGRAPAPGEGRAPAPGEGAAPASSDGGIVSLCYLPVFWIAGENLGILAPLVSGGTSVLLARWDPEKALHAIEQHAVTTMAGTVENYLELLDLLGRPDCAHRDLSSLTAPLTVSFIRKLSPQLRDRWRESTHPGSVLREASYGMTETHTSDTNTLGFQDGDRDLSPDSTFCGLPVPGTDILVADFATGAPLPLGEPGEILVRGPSVLTRYWRAPEATATALRGGWLHTGDIGRLDEDGCLHYLGRDKDMIKVKGMSVFPAEVETLLARHPEVLAAAVVAVDDPETGQRPYAYVRTRPGSALTADELRNWAAATMATYKVPVVELLDDLPLTATGKIRKTELSARASRTRPAP